MFLELPTLIQKVEGKDVEKLQLRQLLPRLKEKQASSSKV
jgi:hypothetical protein